MKKLLLLLMIIPVLMVFPAYGLLTELDFDDFCEVKLANSSTDSADFICELDIFQMKSDINSMNTRLLTLETDNLPSEDYMINVTLDKFSKVGLGPIPRVIISASGLEGGTWAKIIIEHESGEIISKSSLFANTDGTFKTMIQFYSEENPTGEFTVTVIDKETNAEGSATITI